MLQVSKCLIGLAVKISAAPPEGLKLFYGTFKNSDPFFNSLFFIKRAHGLGLFLRIVISGLYFFDQSG